MYPAGPKKWIVTATNLRKSAIRDNFFYPRSNLSCPFILDCRLVWFRCCRSYRLWCSWHQARRLSSAQFSGLWSRCAIVKTIRMIFRPGLLPSWNVPSWSRYPTAWFGTLHPSSSHRFPALARILSRISGQLSG